MRGVVEECEIVNGDDERPRRGGGDDAGGVHHVDVTGGGLDAWPAKPQPTFVQIRPRLRQCTYGNGWCETRGRRRAVSASHADHLDVGELGDLARQFDAVDTRTAGHLVPALFQCDGDAHPPIVPPHALPSVGMSDFWKSRPVLVTGGNGFLGRVVVRLLRERGAEVVAPRKADFDLTVPGRADEMLAQHRPTHVIHLAARVGGIGYNQAAPAQRQKKSARSWRSFPV